MQNKILKIGTRTSLLARKQTDLFIQALEAHYSDVTVEIIPIITTGDKSQKNNRDLSVIGGKGLFLKELENALLARTIDVAVHSLKDVPSWVGPDFVFPCVLEREDPRDAFISNRYKSLDALPSNAAIGSCAQRRLSQVFRTYPSLIAVPFRGNVDSRLEKLDRGDVDATFLAVAGLNRLGLSHRITQYIDVESMIPSAGQGAITVETLSSNDWAISLLKPLNHISTSEHITVERTLVATLGGSCLTPIGVHADLNQGVMRLSAFLGTSDGRTSYRVCANNHQNLSPIEFGFQTGLELYAQVDGFLKTDLGLLQTPPKTFNDIKLNPCGF